MPGCVQHVITTAKKARSPDALEIIERILTTHVFLCFVNLDTKAQEQDFISDYNHFIAI